MVKMNKQSMPSQDKRIPKPLPGDPFFKWIARKRCGGISWVIGFGCMFFFVIGTVHSVEAIILDPSPSQVEEAIARGEMLAQTRQPPVTLYAQFGNQEYVASPSPHGFLMTKLSGVAVMAGHYALRGERPSEQDLSRILSEEELQIVVTVFGDSPIFAQGSYLLMKQGDRLIKPTRIRADGRAESIGPIANHPVFRAKIVATFAYQSFSPEAKTIISVFPGVGGEVTFDLDFSHIP